MNKKLEKHSNVEKRAREIKYLIGISKRLEAAKKLIFFSEDFSTVTSVNKAIMIKAEVVEIEDEAIYIGDLNNVNTSKNKLNKKMLHLVDEITQAYSLSNKEEIKHQIEFDILKPDQVVENLSGNQKLIFFAENIEKNYADFSLQPISLKLYSGQITGIIGKNGSGKSTLLKIICGSIASDNGKLNYPGFNCRDDDWFSIKSNIAYIGHDIGSADLKVSSVLAYSAALHGYRREENDNQVNDLISRLDLEKKAEKSMIELSAGFQLRGALGKALVWRPKILIMDEPFANLDINGQQKLLRDIMNYAYSVKYPVSILVTSHHIDEIESIADQIVLLDEGKVQFMGTMENLRQLKNEQFFEIKTNKPAFELQEILTKYNKDIQVIEYGTFDLVKAPVDCDYHGIQQLFYRNDIIVNYFRDITTSTKKLILENERNI